MAIHLGIGSPGRVEPHENETRKRSFGLAAEAYDAARPRYPAALFAAVAAHAGITPATRALELGSGTGIATLPFAEMGSSILGLELSDAMAEVARRKLARFPRVRIETTRFEDWSGAPGAFDLVFSAQAWHWMPPDVYERTRTLLRAGGTLAVFANWATSNLPEAQAAYRKHAPEVFTRQDGDPPEDVDSRLAEALGSFERSGCFDGIEARRFPWERSFRADEYVALIRTYSDHATLPPEVREPMLGDIARAIDEAGGSVRRSYEAVLLLARPAK
jgi:SAM-dependent methyltransferase